MEHTGVMSMEDMEVCLFNEEIYRVACEVENQSSDALERSLLL